MTRAQIIAELRRAATQDLDRHGVSYEAFMEVIEWRTATNQVIGLMDEWQIYYLLVAAALEGEL